MSMDLLWSSLGPKDCVRCLQLDHFRLGREVTQVFGVTLTISHWWAVVLRSTEQQVMNTRSLRTWWFTGKPDMYASPYTSQGLLGESVIYAANATTNCHSLQSMQMYLDSEHDASSQL